VFVIAWHNMVPGGSLPFDRAAVAFTLAVPASFAWAIAVHRVFEVRVALRAIAVLAITGLLALATYGAGEWLAGTWWPALGEGVSGASLAFLAMVASLAGPARPWLSGLGARVVPITSEVALGAWAPSAEAARSGDHNAMLREACEVIVRALRLDGCSAGRAETGGVRLVSFAGARLMPSPGPGFLEAVGRREGPGELATMDLAQEDRDALDLRRFRPQGKVQ